MTFATEILLFAPGCRLPRLHFFHLPHRVSPAWHTCCWGDAEHLQGQAGGIRGHLFHPPSGGAGGEKPRTVTGGADAGRKFPARPVRTPGRAHGLSEAHSGRTPWRWPQCCRFSLVPPLAIDNGEQAATPPPLKQRGCRASGGHTWPPNIKCGWCWPGAGVPGQRRRAASGGGAKPRAALLPRCKHGPRGGGTRWPLLFFVPVHGQR